MKRTLIIAFCLVSLIQGTVIYGAKVMSKAMSVEKNTPVKKHVKKNSRFKKISDKTAILTHRNRSDISAFLASAYRVADIIKGFPDKKKEARVLKNFCYGAQESGYRRNYCHANIPGKFYSGLPGKKYVKKFSIDIGWQGINEINVRWTYETALALQNGRPFPESANFLSQKTKDFFKKNVHIPENIKLKKIDLSFVKEAHKYWRTHKKTVKPEKMEVPISYEEKSGDDLDSILIYRLLVERDRYDRGWEWKTWNKDLYASLSRIK